MVKQTEQHRYHKDLHFFFEIFFDMHYVLCTKYKGILFKTLQSYM